MMVAMGSGIRALIFLAWSFAVSVRALIHRASMTSDPQRYAVLIVVALMVVGFAAGFHDLLRRREP